MSIALITPLLTALVIALSTTAVHRRVRPQVSAALLTGAILGAVAATVPTMVVLAIGFLVHLPYLGGGFEWCQAVLGFHASANPWLGAVATGLLVVGIIRVVRSVRAWRRHRCVDGGGLALVDSDEWFAYSLPGPGMRVAVSAGLIEALDGQELEVVLAHEQGHALHRHDRHLLAAELAAGLVPPLEFLRRRLRFALERWADEVAVDAVGGDREKVAFTLAKVALGPSETPQAFAAFNGLGVTARVEALLRPRSLSHEGVWSSTLGLGVVAVMLAAGVQAHHLVGLLVTLCPG
ncbi:MAG: M56 family metallopeptidase [Ilumatobacteraceae bacterium]